MKIKEPLFPLLFVLLAWQFSFAQEITDTEKKEAITNLTAKLKDKYVSLDIALKVNVLLLKKLKSGEYYKINPARAFAKAVSDDMYMLSKDLHLKLLYGRGYDHYGRENNPEPEFSMSSSGKMIRYTRILAGNIGYINISRFPRLHEARNEIIEAFNEVEGVEALILDLRANKGGSISTGAFVSSYLFDENPVHLMTIHNRNRNPVEVWTEKRVPGKKMPGIPLYGLIGKGTISQGEVFSYNLKHYGRIVLVGEITPGAGNAGGYEPVSKNFGAFIPVNWLVHPKTGTSFESRGVVPHIEVPAIRALSRAHLESLRTIREKTSDARKLRQLDMDIKKLEAKIKRN